MFPLAFVARWLQGHWWGFISRNYIVWPIFLLMNVFIALKGSHFWFLFKIYQCVICPIIHTTSIEYRFLSCYLREKRWRHKWHHFVMPRFSRWRSPKNKAQTSLTVIRKMQKLYPEEDQLNKMQIYRTVERFAESGSVLDRRHLNTGRPRSVRSAENIQQIRAVIEETPQRSTRRVLGDITNIANATSVYRLLRYDFKLTPYTISVMQHLKPSDIHSRLSFATWMKDHPDIANMVWFSDEAHFYLDAQVNKKNCWLWGSEKPDIYMKSLHSQKLTVWAALSSSGIIGPFFFENEDWDVDTINSTHYLNILKRDFLPAIRWRGLDINSTWFQQDGAAPHTSRIILEWLKRTFGTNFISFKTELEWPLHSPDLNPLDFYLWDYLKDKPAPATLDELKINIKLEIKRISTGTCASVIANFRKRLDLVTERKGRHLEHGV